MTVGRIFVNMLLKAVSCMVLCDRWSCIVAIFTGMIRRSGFLLFNISFYRDEFTVNHSYQMGMDTAQCWSPYIANCNVRLGTLMPTSNTMTVQMVSV